MKGGECDSLNQVDPDLCIKCINQNRDLIVGVKVRLSASVANDGANEEEAFRFVHLVTVDFVNLGNCTLLEVMYYIMISYTGSMISLLVVMVHKSHTLALYWPVHRPSISSLEIVERACGSKNRWGFINRKCNRVEEGTRENRRTFLSFFFFSRALALPACCRIS